MWRTILRVGLLVLLVGAIVTVVATDLPSRIDLDDLRADVRAAGWLGAAGFVLGCALLQPVGVSVYVFLLSAAAMWPTPLAIFLSWLGVVGAGVVAFGLARFVAYDWVHRHMSARLDKYDQRLATHGFRTVLITRLMFYTTIPVQLMYGVSSVRFRDFLAGSAIGLVPATVVGVLAGAQVIAWFRRHPPSSWHPAVYAVAGAIVVAAIAYVVARRRRA